MQISATILQYGLHKVIPKVSFESAFWSIMASAAKHSLRDFLTAEQVLKLLEDYENGTEGMSSGEESVLDHLLLDSEEDSR